MEDLELCNFSEGLTGAAGVGLDFNTELVEAISKVKGANYYSVHTPGEPAFPAACNRPSG
jgi:hypothetical protein